MRRISLLIVSLALLVPLTNHRLAAQEKVLLAGDLAASPNGDRIAFTWRGDIWIALPREGGAIRRVTAHAARDRQPAFSPDGKHLAFVSDRSGSAQVWVMSLDGGAPRRVTRHTDGFELREWTPDGTGLLVRATRDHFWRRAERHFIHPLEGDRAAELLFDGYGSDGRLSADGKKLLYVRESTKTFRKRYRGAQASQVWAFDRTTGKHSCLEKSDTGNRWPMWTAGGDYLYVSERSGTPNLWMNKGGTRTQLTSFEDDGVMFPTISRDGRFVYFRRLFDVHRCEVSSGKIIKIPLTYDGDPTVDRERNLVLDSATEVTFTPDGRVMAFAAGNDIWVMDTVLKEPVRVTDSAAEERSPLFVDKDTLLFVSFDGGDADVWSAKRGDEKKYFWQNTSFVKKRLTQDPAVEDRLRLMPDGKRVSFVRGRGDLFMMNKDGSEVTQLLESWNMPDYDFSPDCKWIAYSVDDDDFNNDVWIKRVDGTGEPFNVSCHPDNDYGPRFSPDGKVLVFTGRRWGDETDIVYCYLQSEESETSSRDRRMEKAIAKMKERDKKKSKSSKSSGKKSGGRPSSKPGKAAATASRPAKKGAKAAPKKTDDSKKVDDKEVKIDFVGLRDRLRRIRISDSRESSLVFMPKGAKLLFSARVGGTSGLHSIEFPDQLRPKLVSRSAPRRLVALPEAKKMAGLLSGKPALMASSGKVESFSFRARQTIDIGGLALAVFRQGWMAMRDGFYDERLGNNNWDAIYRKYADAAADCLDERALNEIGNMMLGELNGSHLGFRMGRFPAETSVSRSTWNVRTGHLGCRFDPDWKGPGLKIRDVVRETPAAMKRSRLAPGEIIVSIDGVTVDPGLDLATVLTGPSDRDVELLVKGTDGKERRVSMRPTTSSRVRAMLYEEWMEDNREKVSELSDGKFGYLHIRAMSGASLLRFDAELYRIGHGKSGLVIDVRENGGGSITDHLLTCLTQPTHAITRPRGGGEGYPHDRRVYATWDKPIVVLCNQNSFSNAEIFSHAVKTLKRGKVVGVRTAGGVISTGGQRLMGIGFVRMPFRGWYLLDGEDMELNGCAPHHEIWPSPGDWPSGVDKQLEKAVEVLAEDVKKWEARPRPKLRKATER